ncbi:MAG: hypothetical protein ABI477_12145 [Chryseolinea sp.]
MKPIKCSALKRWSLLLMLALATAGFSAAAQNQPLDSLISKFNAYKVSNTSEKIYAHVDKDLALTGETIWFKLYLVNESTNKPGSISSVAYVEVVDAFNHPVLQAKVGMKGGYGSGSLFVPASIVSGNYTFRAYTKWMRNFSVEYFFHKKIAIVNGFRKLELDRTKNILKPEIQFFPEGGQLVAGIKSRVAFKILNRGDNNDFKAYILSPENDTLSIATADEMGMGSFHLTTSAGKDYRAVLAGPSGVVSTSKIPVALDAGYVLNVVDSTQDKIALKIQVSSKLSNGLPVFLIIHARNIVSNASIQYMANSMVTVMINKKDLSEGISNITLFNSKMQAVCERLYFSPVDRKMSVQASTSQHEYGVRRKVSVELVSQDANKKGVPASLSLAVYRTDSLQSGSEPGIYNYIWLQSDLVDVPKLPYDFFETMDSKKVAILDNIMLVHGWRKFKWSDVVSDPKAIGFIPELRSHVISAHVTNNDAPNPGAMTYLSSPGLNIQVYGSISDGDGLVKWETKDFYGPRRIVIQTNLSKDSTSRVTIVSPYSDKFAVRKYAPFYLTPSVEKQLMSRNISMQVQDIFYQDKGALTRNGVIDTTAFYGKADETYYLDDYTRFPVMEEVMREYVRGVLVRKRRDGFHFINLDNINKSVFDQDPFIMIDGIPLFDADRIMAFDPLKIKKLEVVTRRYYMGVLSLPGIVSYTTYAGDLGGFQLDPKCVVMDYEGLQYQREFYVPKYETSKLRDSRLPDRRNLLFWAPNVTTDAEGKCQLEFFTSDVQGDFKLVVEGNTRQGLSGSGTSSFVVRSFDN